MNNWLLKDEQITKAQESGIEKFGEGLHEYQMGRSYHPKPSIDFIYDEIAKAQARHIFERLNEECTEHPKDKIAGYMYSRYECPECMAELEKELSNPVSKEAER